MLRAQKAAIFLAGLLSLLAFAAGLAVGQGQTPSVNRGLSAAPLKSLDLTKEIDSVRGRPLRLRKITLQPGGVIGLHTHKDRPTVSYMLEGEVTYHQDGKPTTVVRAGDGIAEGKETTHWAENRGSMPAVWIAVDVPKEL